MNQEAKGGAQVSSNTTVAGEVARLTALVEDQGRLLEEQRRRLEELERRGTDGGDGNGHADSKHSRREILRLAGIAAAGAAGAAGVTALQALPAAAATGGNMVLGHSNDADAATILNPSVAAESAAAGLLDVDGSITSGTTPGLAVNATANFFRAVRGIAPLTPNGNPVSGVGVWGSSDGGAAILGSCATGVDFWSFNSGRVLQAAQPAGQPTYQGGVYDSVNAVWTDFEVIRDDNGYMWIFMPPSLNGSNIAPTGTSGGNWIPVQTGGLGQSLFTVVSNKQYGLSGSDGHTFTDMIPTTGGAADLVLSITPAFNCNAIITGNADLFTNTAGMNQDIGIAVNPSGLPVANQNIVAWKESGGFAGTFSPNAAFVETVVALTRGTTYDVRLKWKTNKPQTGTIYAGAGPFPPATSTLSPTRLTALLVINP
jgi:hypothetical protein